jgi:hypothetical protein
VLVAASFFVERVKMRRTALKRAQNVSPFAATPLESALTKKQGVGGCRGIKLYFSGTMRAGESGNVKFGRSSGQRISRPSGLGMTATAEAKRAKE